MKNDIKSTMLYRFKTIYDILISNKNRFEGKEFESYYSYFTFLASMINASMFTLNDTVKMMQEESPLGDRSFDDDVTEMMCCEVYAKLLSQCWHRMNRYSPYKDLMAVQNKIVIELREIQTALSEAKHA